MRQNYSEEFERKKNTSSRTYLSTLYRAKTHRTMPRSHNAEYANNLPNKNSWPEIHGFVHPSSTRHVRYVLTITHPVQRHAIIFSFLPYKTVQMKMLRLTVLLLLMAIRHLQTSQKNASEKRGRTAFVVPNHKESSDQTSSVWFLFVFNSR